MWVGDWFDWDGKIVFGNGFDKCVGGYIYDFVCQMFDFDFVLSVVVFWLYGVGGVVVEWCNIGN